MEEITRLNLAGFSGRAISNTFFRQDAPTKHLVVVFPGLGYTCSMPLLYYPTRLFVEHGADVLWVETQYNQAPEFDALGPQEQLNWIAVDASAAVHTALAQREYASLTLVGKSLGSLALAALALNEPAVNGASFIWLTPLTRNPSIQKAAAQARPRSLFILGDADSLYTPEGLAQLQKTTQGQVLLVPGADHSLEIPGDLPASLRAIQQTLDAIQTFCPL
jgi:hypothetical protein